MTTAEITAQPGLFLAEYLGGHWHPEPLIDDPEQTSGHLELDGVFVYLGMGFTDTGGEWLQIAYLYAKPEPHALPSDTSACGRGVGTKVVNGLREWTNTTGIPLRFISIENPGFFARFAGWDDATFSEDEPDGECWYYPEVD